MFARMGRFSYPSDNMLSTPPKYVYTGGYDNQFSKKLGEDKVVRSTEGFTPDPGLYDDEKHHIEVLRRGGIVYVTPPDSPEEFRKYEDEMRRKLDKKKFADDPKKTKQAVFGVPVGSDNIEVSVREPKEKEIAAKGTQLYFGDEFKEGRKAKKSFARSPAELRELNDERVALLYELNNSLITRDRRSEVVKRLDQIYNILENEDKKFSIPRSEMNAYKAAFNKVAPKDIYEIVASSSTGSGELINRQYDENLAYGY